MTTSGVTYAQTRQITWVPYAPKISGATSAQLRVYGLCAISWLSPTELDHLKNIFDHHYQDQRLPPPEVVDVVDVVVT